MGPTTLEKREIEVDGRGKPVLLQTQQFLEGRPIALFNLGVS